MYNFPLSSELARKLKSLQVEIGGNTPEWERIESSHMPMTAVPVFLNNHAPATYVLRAVVVTVGNLTDVRQEIDRSYIEVTKGKGEDLHTKAK